MKTRYTTLLLFIATFTLTPTLTLGKIPQVARKARTVNHKSRKQRAQPAAAHTRTTRTKSTTSTTDTHKKKGQTRKTAPATSNDIVEQSSTYDVNIKLAPKKKKAPKKLKNKKEKKEKEQRKTIRDMTYAELKPKKDALIAQNKPEVALKYLERMLKLCTDTQELGDVLLEFADANFACKHYQKAENVFTEYSKLYPGNKSNQYALYKAVDCAHRQTLPADRDQTPTHKTIKLTDKFLARESFTTFKEQVEDIRQQCYTLLVQSELEVATYYLKSGAYPQAWSRIKGVRKDLLEKIPSTEPLLLECEYWLAQKQKDTKLADEKLTELALKYPDASIKIVKKQNSPLNLATRF